jgi:hypothetical protein
MNTSQVNSQAEKMADILSEIAARQQKLSQFLRTIVCKDDKAVEKYQSTMYAYLLEDHLWMMAALKTVGQH